MVFLHGPDTPRSFVQGCSGRRSVASQARVRQDTPLVGWKASKPNRGVFGDQGHGVGLAVDSFVTLPNHHSHACPCPPVRCVAVPIPISWVACAPHIVFGIVALFTGYPEIADSRLVLVESSGRRPLVRLGVGRVHLGLLQRRISGHSKPLILSTVAQSIGELIIPVARVS